MPRDPRSTRHVCAACGAITEVIPHYRLPQGLQLLCRPCKARLSGQALPSEGHRG
jgi:hypothetical protein